MPLCYDCRDSAETDNRRRWHYRTIDEPCELCGDAFSHELVLSRVGDRLP